MFFLLFSTLAELQGAYSRHGGFWDHIWAQGSAEEAQSHGGGYERPRRTGWSLSWKLQCRQRQRPGDWGHRGQVRPAEDTISNLHSWPYWLLELGRRLLNFCFYIFMFKGSLFNSHFATGWKSVRKSSKRVSRRESGGNFIRYHFQPPLSLVHYANDELLPLNFIGSFYIPDCFVVIGDWLIWCHHPSAGCSRSHGNAL